MRKIIHAIPKLPIFYTILILIPIFIYISVIQDNFSVYSFLIMYTYFLIVYV